MGKEGEDDISDTGASFQLLVSEEAKLSWREERTNL